MFSFYKNSNKVRCITGDNFYLINSNLKMDIISLNLQTVGVGQLGGIPEAIFLFYKFLA